MSFIKNHLFVVALFFYGPLVWGDAPAKGKTLLPQAQVFSCDFDDNIFFTDAKIYLWDAANQREIPVTTQNWALVKNKVGKAGEWKNMTIRQESLRDFRDDSELGTDIVKVQVERALEKKGARAFAPSFNAMRDALSHPSTRKRFFVITARENSPAAILKGFEVLKERGYLSALPLVENIFPVLWKEFPPALRGDSVSESKANVMLRILDELEKEPMPSDALEVDGRDGTVKEKLHLWGFSDDDFDNFSKAREVLAAQVAKGRWPHVKVSLFFTGLNNPLESSRAEVIMNNGLTRPATKNEGTRMGSKPKP